MINKQTVQTIGIQAEYMNKQRKLPKKDEWQYTENRSSDVIETRKLVDFSYHLQIHDWGWIPSYLREENVWNNILELTKVDFFLDFFFFLCVCRSISRDVMHFFKYCRSISRDVMQSNFFFPRGQVLVFIKD